MQCGVFLLQVGLLKDSQISPLGFLRPVRGESGL
jgi:hypothetical protein